MSLYIALSLNTFLLYHFPIPFSGGSDGKEMPAMQETQVQSLGQEYPLKKGMATHSSILACRIPWTEEPGGVHGVTKTLT